MAGHRPSSRAATARWLLAAVLLGLCTGLATLDLVAVGAVLTLGALVWWCTRLDWWQRCAAVMFSALALASFDPGVLGSAELTQAVGALRFAAALVLGALTWGRARSTRPLGPQTRWFLLTHRWHSAPTSPPTSSSPGSSSAPPSCSAWPCTSPGCSPPPASAASA